MKITGMETGIFEGAQTSIAESIRTNTAALKDDNPDDGITPAVQNADGKPDQ